MYPFALYSLLFDNPIFSSPLDESHEIILGPARRQIVAINNIALAINTKIIMNIVSNLISSLNTLYGCAEEENMRMFTMKILNKKKLFISIWFWMGKYKGRKGFSFTTLLNAIIRQILFFFLFFRRLSRFATLHTPFS